jgi:hypothetical protein
VASIEWNVCTAHPIRHSPPDTTASSDQNASSIAPAVVAIQHRGLGSMAGDALREAVFEHEGMLPVNFALAERLS